MNRIHVPFLDLPSQHRALKTEFMAVFERALDTAGFIGGREVVSFEEEFASFVGASFCAGVGSGTDALRLALQALGIGRGDLVVTVPNTFIATTEAITQAGADIAFADIDPHTCLLCPQKLEELLKTSPRRPKAIIPVHLYGQCADMEATLDLARRYECLVVEDAAQAHGASRNGRNAGTMGHAAAFSFYPGKNLGACGEAGAVTTSDPEVAKTVRMLRDHGQTERYQHMLEGTNARLDAVQAGILRVKLPHLPEWNRIRRTIAQTYDRSFAGLANIRPVRIDQGNVPSRHLYVVHSENREELGMYLAAQGVQTGMHYPLPLHLQPCYRHLSHGRGAFPAAEASAASLLSLPIFPGMTEEQTALVTDSVIRFAESAQC